jgi:hypothetical protein
MQEIDRRGTGPQSICSQRGVDTRSHIVSLVPILEQVTIGTRAVV